MTTGRREFDGVSVDLDVDGTSVNVYGSEGCSLTPDDARHLAAALTELASTAEQIAGLEQRIRSLKYGEPVEVPAGPRWFNDPAPEIERRLQAELVERDEIIDRLGGAS